MRLTATSLWIGLMALAPPAGTQENPTSTARELYYAAAPLRQPAGKSAAPGKQQGPAEQPSPTGGVETGGSSAQAKLQALGLRYRILKMNLGGDFVSVPPESAFHSMDRIRIQLESNKVGYLYVICQASDSTWEVLFPSPKIRDNKNDLQAFEPLTVPALQEFVFDQTPGTERVYVVLSEHPVVDLDALVKSVRSDAFRSIPPPVGGPTLLALKGIAAEAETGPRNRNLLISRPKEGEADLQARDSVYLVDISTERSRVTAEIRLRHE